MSQKYEQDELHDDMFKERRRNPLVLVGAAATAGVLCAGLLAFKQGNSDMSQRMMRARVAFQAITVGLMAGSAGLYTFTQPK
ncbi:g1450 [Coccomyxa viridis]|uniref:G1450 protein n=1 Tax=Coccomyxa viridis TaxID=1274662 RepID=A0ABP1FI12_9CHLO